MIIPKGISTGNIFQPTGSLYDFRFKSYGPLCVVHKSGDLDLVPIFQKIWPIVPGPEYIGCQKIRMIGPAVCPVHPSKTDIHIDIQTDKQTAVTNILCENRRFRKVKKTTICTSCQRSFLINCDKTLNVTISVHPVLNSRQIHMCTYRSCFIIHILLLSINVE